MTSTSIRRGDPIYTDGNDDLGRETVTETNLTTNAEQPKTGLVGCSFRLAATRNGTAIDASLSKAATEMGSLGIYYAIFEGADIMTHLNNATYWNVDVYQTFGDGANINFTVARKVIRIRP